MQQRHGARPTECGGDKGDDDQSARQGIAGRDKRGVDGQAQRRKRNKNSRHDRWPVETLFLFAITTAQPDKSEYCQRHRVDEQDDGKVGAGRVRHVGDGPGAGAEEGRRHQEFPVAHAGDHRGGGKHDGEIDEQRPWIWRLRGHERRRRHGTDETDTGQGQAVYESGGDRRHADGAEQREGKRRADEAINAMGGIDGAEQDEGTGRRQDRRNIGAGNALHRHLEPGAANELAAGDQHQPEHRCHGEPHAGAENASLDGVADQEQATQRQRDAADPDRPARAERRLDIRLAGRFGRRCRRPWFRCLRLARGPRAGHRLAGHSYRLRRRRLRGGGLAHRR